MHNSERHKWIAAVHPRRRADDRVGRSPEVAEDEDVVDTFGVERIDESAYMLVVCKRGCVGSCGSGRSGSKRRRSGTDQLTVPEFCSSPSVDGFCCVTRPGVDEHGIVSLGCEAFDLGTGRADRRVGFRKVE